MPAQSVLARHCTQAPAGAQNFAGPPAQSVFERHSTQLEVAVLQMGVGDEHWVLAVQPVRQRSWSGSQMGAAEPQSASLRQATQRWSRTRQRGSPAGQSALDSHATQVFEVGSQMGVAAAQSLSTLQPTHVPSALQVVPPATMHEGVVQAV